jgi:hypothetical protein
MRNRVSTAGLCAGHLRDSGCTRPPRVGSGTSMKSDSVANRRGSHGCNVSICAWSASVRSPARTSPPQFGAGNVSDSVLPRSSHPNLNAKPYSGASARIIPAIAACDVTECGNAAAALSREASRTSRKSDDGYLASRYDIPHVLARGETLIPRRMAECAR